MTVLNDIDPDNKVDAENESLLFRCISHFIIVVATISLIFLPLLFILLSIGALMYVFIVWPYVGNLICKEAELKGFYCDAPFRICVWIFSYIILPSIMIAVALARENRQNDNPIIVTV